MEWTTPDDLEAQVRRWWDRGDLLREPPANAGFPRPLRLKRPDTRALSEQFADAQGWIRTLESQSKGARGFGYEIEWIEVSHRVLGSNRVPVAAFVPTREDALLLAGKRKHAARFEQLVIATRDAQPALDPWIQKRPLVLLEHAEHWGKILAVLTWFQENPRPAVYLRQLEIPGVDTKFIETHKGILSELLDLVLPEQAVDASARRDFERRYGLLGKPATVRFRILDRAHYIAGLSDLTVTAMELGALRPTVRTVFITENEINGLSFPDVTDAMVIMGLGYTVERLAEIPWLRDKAVHYWGDLDTHGFAILDRLRGVLPHVASTLMDHDTLMSHQPLWVREESRCPTDLTRLTESELDVFDALRWNRVGENVRLEQERIGFGHVRRAVEKVARGFGGATSLSARTSP
jgi:hypothetical protein